jgi:hypothetical protein
VSASSSRAATPPLTPASQHGRSHSRSRSSSSALTTTATAAGEPQPTGDADSDVSGGSETSPTSTLYTRHRSRGLVTLSHKGSFSGHRSGGVSPLALRSSSANSGTTSSSNNSGAVRVVRTGSVAKLSSGLRNGSVSGAAGTVGPPRAKRKVTRRNCFFLKLLES